MNPDGMVGLLNYRQDGITPYMLFFKDGLLIEKCVSNKLSLKKSHTQLSLSKQPSFVMLLQTDGMLLFYYLHQVFRVK